MVLNQNNKISHITPSQYAKGFVLGAGANAGAQYAVVSGPHIILDSARDINLESVQDSQTNRSNQKNSGWNVGAFLGYSGNNFGLGVEGSVQAGKGSENSDSETQRNSYINGNQVTLSTKRDANLKGAMVNANCLEAEIGNDLTIESRQDSSTYDSKQTQTSAGASVAIYGSGSSAQQRLSRCSRQQRTTTVSLEPRNIRIQLAF